MSYGPQTTFSLHNIAKNKFKTVCRKLKKKICFDNTLASKETIENINHNAQQWMKSQILKFLDSQQSQKSKYLEHEIVFLLQIK